MQLWPPKNDFLYFYLSHMFIKKRTVPNRSIKAVKKSTFVLLLGATLFGFGGPNFSRFWRFLWFFAEILSRYFANFNIMKYDFWRSRCDPNRSIKVDFWTAFILVFGTILFVYANVNQLEIQKLLFWRSNMHFLYLVFNKK